MLTEVATGRPVVSLVDAREIAADIAAAEEARMLRRDATALVERMAVRARAAGVDHPVAAAVALASRVSSLVGPEAFAERLGIPLDRLVAAESGAVRFGDLPVAYDGPCAALGLDLLSLADLERQWFLAADEVDESAEN
ncbi:MAG: hypothetical protein R8F63_00095 [Acidimicrobiales bacterium]|nr:hypothetical protein [Acidimicrobiales bacterium]